MSEEVVGPLERRLRMAAEKCRLFRDELTEKGLTDAVDVIVEARRLLHALDEMADGQVTIQVKMQARVLRETLARIDQDWRPKP